jgi:hypothetical protein
MSELTEGIITAVEKYERDMQLARPQVSETAHRWAECLPKGRFLFYSTREVDVGLRDIDWSGSHVQHQEWPAQLNRFFWLPHLAALYREEDDEDLAALARRTIEDWIDQHEYAADSSLAPGDNTLNMSIRLGQSHSQGWWRSVPDLAASEHFDESFIQRMLDATRGQIEFLSRNLTLGGNWRISQLDCILFCSLVIPGLEDHREQAVRGLNEGAHRQIEEDGSHEEHNPSSYHRWMCQAYTNHWRLQQARPELGLHVPTERVGRAWNYTVCSAAPDGGSSGLHDAGVWSQGPGEIRDLGERDAFIEEAELEGPQWDLARSPSRWFPEAGQLFLRDGWDAEDTYICFDATRWGGAHCHLSRNSVNLYSGGRMLLIDPGTFSYEMTDPYAPHGKSTRAHNTITPGGLNQTQADPDIRALQIGRHVSLLASRYEGGYCDGEYTWGWWDGHGRSIYGRHDRALIWLKGRCALVFDGFHADTDLPAEAHWHLPVGPVELDDENRTCTTNSGESNLLIRCLHSSHEVDIRVRKGEEDPLLGWLPANHGSEEYVPAPVLSMESATGGEPLRLITLLLPFGDEKPPAVRTDMSGDAAQSLAHLRWGDGVEHLVACNAPMDRQIGSAGPIETDAAGAVLTLENGRLVRAFLYEGMYLRWNGSVLVDEPGAGIYERQLP